MSELTKEFFEKSLKNLVTNEILDHKLDIKLADQTKELKDYAREQTDELARMVKAGFDSVDEQFADLAQKLDVRGAVFKLETRVGKIEDRLGAHNK